MLARDRQQFVDVAVAQIEELFRVPPGSFFRDSVRAKLLLLLQIVDRVSRPAVCPVHFMEIVPGYDLFVSHNPDVALPEDPALDEVAPEAVSSVDESSLALVAAILNTHFAQRVAQGGGEVEAGGHVFEAEDGLVYTLCRARDRDEIARSLGVTPGSVVRASDVLRDGGL